MTTKHGRHKLHPLTALIIAAFLMAVLIGILIGYYAFPHDVALVHAINGVGSHGNAGKVIMRAPKVKQQLSLAEMHLYHVLHVLHVRHLHVLHVRHLAHLARVRAMLRA